MPSAFERELHSEAEYLRQASLFVGRSELENAIALLERARLLVPVTKRLLNALGKLYLTAGKPAQAAECFQSVLNRMPRVGTETYEELPVAEDMQYLAEQALELTEKEYSFEISDESKDIASGRKILSLGIKKSTQAKKIVFKNRRSKTFNEQPEDIQAEASEFADGELPSFDLNDAADELAPVNQAPSEEYTPLEESDACSNDFVELDDDHEPDFTIRYGISIVDKLDLDLADADEEVSEHIDDIEFELGELPDLAVVTDWSLDIYDHWTDDLLDDVDEDIDTGVLEDRLSREQRARQVAIECVDTFDWDKSSLPFLTDVFVVLGWNNARKALERAVLTGATYEELILAFHIKQIWGECDRYWISFTGAWVPGETTSATYMHLSWRQALRLIRVFNGIPSSEEVLDLVESEFEFWYDDPVMRACFPAFSKYLFSYRFNESLPTLPVGEHRRFDLNVAFDEMNAAWTYHPLSDEMRMLCEYGIDVINRYAPKSYYASDVDFDPSDLDSPSSKKNSVETVFDDEIF